MQANTKKITVCMLAYNTASYIQQAIESVLAQETVYDFELLIVDDCSTDNTLNLAQTYQQKHPKLIRILANDKNLGLAANYLKALQLCEGEYIAMLDSDDYWTDPSKLQKQVETLEHQPEYGVVYSDCRVVDAEGKLIDWPQMEAYRKQFRSGDLFFDFLSFGTFIPNLTTVFRRSLLEGLYETGLEEYITDWWLWFCFSAKTGFYYYPHVTADYRWHAANQTQAMQSTPAEMKKMLDKSYIRYYSAIRHFDQVNRKALMPVEKQLIFRKLAMLLYRPALGWRNKARLMPLVWKYFPGIRQGMALLTKKMHDPGIRVGTQ